MSAKLKRLQVPARSIAPPASISPEARMMLSSVADQTMQWADYPAPDDAAGWYEYRAIADGNMMAMLGPVAEQLPAFPATVVEVGFARANRIDARGEGCSAGRILLTLHGGALIAGGGKICELLARLQATVFQALVIAPDYRMPPEHPFPAALEDCVAIYRDTIAKHAPEAIVVHGMSAGGNLAAALMLRLREEGLPPPAGLILETPELDLTESGDTFETNAIIDTVLQRRLGPINQLYAGAADLAHPHLSPLFGELSGFPPTLLTAGTRDMFLSNAVRMHQRMRAAGVRAELLIYEAMPHGGFFGTPEDMQLKQDIRRFAEEQWAAAQPRLNGHPSA